MVNSQFPILVRCRRKPNIGLYYASFGGDMKNTSIFHHRKPLQCLVIFTVVYSAVMLVGAAPTAAATACEQLASLVLPNAKVDSAQMVAAGAFVPPGAPGARRGAQEGGGPRGAGSVNAFAKLPPFCRVTATLTPSSDSDIKTEIWLPASGWNGKFEAVGNGGWAGT